MNQREIALTVPAIPIAEEAEKASLALLSCDANALLSLPWDSSLFFDVAHKTVFEALARSGQRTGKTNPVAVISELETNGQLVQCGGKLAVREILRHVVMPPGEACIAAAEDFRQALLRAKAYRETINIIRQHGPDIKAMRADLGQIAADISALVTPAKAAPSLKSIVASVIDELESKTPAECFPTGISNFDPFLGGGIQRGEMAVVAAETSGGKSILLYQMALNALRLGKSVAIFSLEMPAAKIIRRIASNMIGKPLLSIAQAKEAQRFASPQDIVRTLAEISAFPATIRDDLSGVAEIEAEARRLASIGKADLIIVDYLQIATLAKADNREQAVSEFARRLKTLAMSCQSAVATASQLNDDGKVRESRAIGQHTDHLWLISHDGPASFITVEKNRRGERKKNACVTMLGDISRFQAAETKKKP